VRHKEIARIALLALMIPAAAAPLCAQEAALPRARPRAEARVDYLGPDPHAVQVGLGVNVPAGTYLRVALIGAGGTSWNDGRTGGSVRADIVGRFSFDPFRERRWGLSAGGGLSVRYDQVTPERGRWRPLLALLVDIEGPRIGSVAPALQLGLAGGTRIGAIVRGAARDRR
jgi:hypothetical protein